MERTPRPRKRSTKRYPAPPVEGANDGGSSYAKVLELVPPGSRVLDAGCASGGLAARLAARGDRVWGVDLNPAALAEAARHCEATRVADLESVELAELFPGVRFDVVVFADVLEHLKEPWRLLESARAVLDEGGSVVASVPNFAHAAVRLAVFAGSLPYATLGILDDTHVRFFTREGVEALFEESGFRLHRILRTELPFGTPSDLVPDVGLMRVPGEVERLARQDPESETLQFVVRAIPLPGVWDMGALRSRLHDVQARAELQAVGLRNAERELAGAARAATDAEALRAEAAEGVRAELAEARRAFEETRRALEETQRALDEAHERVRAAEAARDEAWTSADDAAQHTSSQIEAVVATAEAARAGAAELDRELRALRDELARIEAERDEALVRANALAELERELPALRDALLDADRRHDEAFARANALDQGLAGETARAEDLAHRLRAAESAAIETRQRLDEALAHAARERAAHALERVRLHDAKAAELARAREDGAAELTRLREAHAAETAALREALAADRAAERTWFENALRDRDAALADREAQLERVRAAVEAPEGGTLEGTITELRAELRRAGAELFATRVQLDALRDHARREALVRFSLEHELAGLREDGAEFWRELRLPERGPA
ncbi:MAG TPA: methyltransferase domain-containing protein [Candidatus Elarobacter sp.]|jgi:2-polyprenyl-3-methyl-5-hydroxy-6-metoxy-1,4-benzoquinol methylase|nr:methyltransferase domain-containing protein [Candidatus Elarobacter sp.]